MSDTLALSNVTIPVGDFNSYQSYILTQYLYFHSSKTFGYFLQYWLNC